MKTSVVHYTRNTEHGTDRREVARQCLCARCGQKERVFRPRTLVHSLRLSAFFAISPGWRGVHFSLSSSASWKNSARASTNRSAQGARGRCQMPSAHLRSGQSKTSASIGTHTATNCTGSRITGVCATCPSMGICVEL